MSQQWLEKAPAANKVDTKPSTFSANMMITNKTIFRVAAPFVWIQRKDFKPPEIAPSPQFTSFLDEKPNVLVRDLSSFLSDRENLQSLINKSTDNLKHVTKAAGGTVYMVDAVSQEIYRSEKDNVKERHRIKWKIQKGASIAGHVAYYKQPVLVEDILEDQKFAESIEYLDDAIKSVLCVPVMTTDEECFGVIELFKLVSDKPFTKADMEIALVVTGWIGATVHENSKRLQLQREIALNNYLKNLTYYYFYESVLLDKMIHELLKFAKTILSAEKAAMFILDKQDNELLADFYEETGEGGKDDGSTKRPQKVYLLKDKGFAAIVATTGVTINVKDAYTDPRFNEEADQKTGYITRSILCIAITGSKQEDIIGVLQVINKQKFGASFTSSDETLLSTFAKYSTVILAFANRKNNYEKLKHLDNIFTKIGQLQYAPCSHDTEYYHSNLTIDIPKDFASYSFIVKAEDKIQIPQLGAYILRELMAPIELDMDAAIDFILSIKKLHRNNPFHNFEHGFQAFHCMSLMLRNNTGHFTPLEIIALLLASLCHCVDHSTFTNSFLDAREDDLTHLKLEAMNEQHSADVTHLIMGYVKLFPGMSSETYQLLLEEINWAVVALHDREVFACRRALHQLLETRTFSFCSQLHRSYVKALMMKAASTCEQMKPFSVAQKFALSRFAERCRQGDVERTMSVAPLPQFDRSKLSEIPEVEIRELSTAILPCFDLLRQVLPNTRTMFFKAKQLRNTWQEIINVRGLKCWRQRDSIVKKKIP